MMWPGGRGNTSSSMAQRISGASPPQPTARTEREEGSDAVGDVLLGVFHPRGRLQRRFGDRRQRASPSAAWLVASRRDRARLGRRTRRPRVAGQSAHGDLLPHVVWWDGLSVDPLYAAVGLDDPGVDAAQWDGGDPRAQ